MKREKELDPAVADVIAHEIERVGHRKRGYTLYTHWFQPLTGCNCFEAYDSFISAPEQREGSYEFFGKELIKGEPDASSFPSKEA